ncbi:MAG: proton-conducting transporter membrane subunit [Bacillota bacterium]
MHAVPEHSYIIINNLPLYIIILPLLGTVLIAIFNKRETLRNLTAVLVSGGTFLLCCLLFLQVLEGGTVSASWPHFIGIGLNLAIDLFGALFALFASCLWFLAVLFSWTYMSHENRRTRYYIFLILTLSGCLGVFLTGDFFSLFLFFEMMSLASYVLVIHSETGETMEAGRNYLYLSIIGGLSLLIGILLLYFSTGSTAITPQLEKLTDAGFTRILIVVFMIIGFGIKAGMVPLHIWLPKAHPVAPSPASALLSGIMIKTGAYGISRVVNLLMTPAGGEHGSWHFTEKLGLIIIWFAVATMLSAALMALFQTNIKRILAYSSISQMGYILMGVGCAAYLGYEGPIGFAAFSYHILNHAFFKAGLFMMVGAVYARTHELELSRLGGLARSFPVTATAFLVAAAGIAGFPGFNGYISKTLLHHAIVEAYEHHHLFSLHLAEYLFTITGALTVCYIFKLFTGIFTGSKPAHLRDLPREPFLERVVFTVIAVVIVYLGTTPQTVLHRVVEPATAGFGYDSHAAHHLLELDFLNLSDMLGVLIPIALGLALLFVMQRMQLFHKIRFPYWLSVDRYVYAPVSKHSLALFTIIGQVMEKNIDRSYVALPSTFSPVYHGLAQLEENHMARWGRWINLTVVRIREMVYHLWMTGITTVFGNLSRLLKQGFRTLFQVDYRPQEKVFRTINISNLDFNLLIIVLTLIIILGITVFLR